MCLLQTKSPFRPSLPQFLLRSPSPFLRPLPLSEVIAKVHGFVSVHNLFSEQLPHFTPWRSDPEFVGQFLCNGYVLSPFTTFSENLPSTTRVQGFEKSLRQCSGGTH